MKIDFRGQIWDIVYPLHQKVKNKESSGKNSVKIANVGQKGHSSTDDVGKRVSFSF